MGKEVQAILNLLNEGVVVEGDIQTPRDIRIDGTLVGTVRTDGRLVLGPSSRVSGKVNSPNIDVFGNVEGDIVSTGIVVLRAKSNVKGQTSKYITPTSAVSTGISKGMTSSYFTANSKRCMMTLPKKWTKSQNVS